jgi:hypothetical protein
MYILAESGVGLWPLARGLSENPALMGRVLIFKSQPRQWWAGSTLCDCRYDCRNRSDHCGVIVNLLPFSGNCSVSKGNDDCRQSSDNAYELRFFFAHACPFRMAQSLHESRGIIYGLPR